MRADGADTANHTGDGVGCGAWRTPAGHAGREDAGWREAGGRNLVWHAGDGERDVAAEGEAAGGSCWLATVADGEVTVGVGVASARGDMGWVQDVGVDQFEVVADAGEPFLVALFHVFVPELGALEELGAAGDFAAEFVGVFLLHVLFRC